MNSARNTISLRHVSILTLLIVTSAMLVSYPASGSGELPGQPPEAFASVQALSDSMVADASSAEPEGLEVVVLERGRISHSTDGAGTLGNTSVLRLEKPEGANLRMAAFFAASTGFVGEMQGGVWLDGNEIEFDHQVSSNIQSENYWTDVTSLVREKVDEAPGGTLTFEVYEEQSWSVDGVILTLIFDDANQAADRSVALLFGATQTRGDRFTLRMERPIDPDTPTTLLEMSLGISYGFQTGVSDQFSIVDVNGERLTSSAGGEDDGESANGALITVGGEGDEPTNPSPYGVVAGPRSDDELYDLRPFVSAGDMTVTVETENPSNDDNIFYAAFVTDPPVAAIGTPSNPGPVFDNIRMVSLGDSFSSGEGTYNYDNERRSSVKFCHRGPEAWPRLLEANVWSIIEIDHKACTGAETENLLGPQSFNPYQGVSRQIPLPNSPEPDVGLVTLTIGGNDVGFADILTDCVKPSTPGWRNTCSDYPYSDAFEERLDGLYRALRDDVYPALEIAYPNAYIVHVGYPRIFPDPSVDPFRCNWLSNEEQRAAAELNYQLNGTIYLATQTSSRIQWLDVTSILAGHELCTRDSWMVPLTLGSNSERGHPTKPGQEAYARAVAAGLGLQWGLSY